MRLPKDLLSKTYTKPKLFLCETDKTKICQLETVDMQGSFKFNAYSELTFTVGRTYVDIATGEIRVNPHYNKIEALRLVYLEGFGYFEIQEPEIFSDGIQESKNITAYGLEYRLAQKYIEGIKINTGEADSVEVIVAGNSRIIPVTLLNNVNENLSLLDIALEKIYDWSIGHVDDSLKTMSRQFDISRASVYDFIVQDICEKFNCYAIFDTINNKINLYAEALVSKHIGDGKVNEFTVSPIFDSLGSVSINSYKTTKYTYDSKSGILTFDEAPANGAKIEIVDGSQEKWQTDVYVTFDNLAKEVNVSYSAEDIKTVLTVKGEDNLSIREVNMGLPYIVDLSYYHTVDWMGQDLYDKYTKYLQENSDAKQQYLENSKKIFELSDKITYEKQRLSLQYSIASNVTSTTVGTYYVRGGDVILTEEQKEIAKTMETEFSQTYIDLTTRPKVSWEKMHEAGWDTEEGSYSTLHTVTFLYSDFCTIENGQKDYAINVTPILPSGYVINGGHDGLFDYIDKQLKDGVNFQNMGNIFIGIYDSLEDAEAAAERLHVLQEQFYQYGFPVPNYYYREVKLPSEYNANIKTYYKLSGNDLNEDKFSKWYEALQTYFVSKDDKDVSKFEEVKDNFTFVEQYTIDTLVTALSDAASLEQKDEAVLSFLDEIWDQLGRTPLDSLYLKTYKTVESTNTEAGWNDESNENYWRYYPVTLVIESLENEIKDRDSIIEDYQEEYNSLKEENNNIANEASIYKFFNEKQLARLSPFFREDEYTDDNFVETDSDTIEMLMKTKQELLECGRIELSKLCEPKLEFSMDMANIYALDEFEPIINQFQLGNFINVVIRPDYVKKARLLSVDINFDDFSDFSCEFGELTSLKTQSSIHADLLAAALTAGNSVASSQSYWEKGADLATSTDLKIQSGLLNAIDGIYSADKSVLIDNHGILLRKVEDSGEFSPYQIWLTNNHILVSTDGFDTAKTGIGVFEIDGKERYGVLAEAVIAGYIESSDIVGGTIDIGDGKFVVDKFGNVTMNAASIKGYVEEDGVISSINQSQGEITINADRISLAGKEINLTNDNITISSTNFSVTKDGNITASNADISGKITSTSGEIGGWTIYEGLLRKETVVDDVTYQMYMQASDGVSTTNAFAVRKKNPDVSSWDVQFSVAYDGKMTAKNANVTGTITATAGSIAGYNIGPGGSYDNAIYKRVAGDGTGVDYEVGLKATSGDTDLAFYVKQSEDNWASNSNVFYVRNNGQLYAQNANITGKVTASSGSIGSWTIGDLDGYTGSIYSTFCATSTPSSSNPEYAVFMRGKGSSASTIAMAVKKRTSSATSWSEAEETFYVLKNGHVKMADADVTGNINASSGSISGNLNISGSLVNTQGDYTVTLRGVQSDAGKGVFYVTDNSSGSAEYPVRINGDGSARFTNVTIAGNSKIASACIPDLDASKITSGEISTDILSSSVITTDNFSTKALTTGNLSVTYGGNIGIWTVNSNNCLYAISGNYGVSLSATSVSHGQGDSATWVNIVKAGQNASDERLKKNICEFDDKFDRIFDSLKPVKFEYSKEFLGKGTRFGYIAQDVIKSFKDEGENIDDYSFVYETEMEDNSTDQYYQLNKSDFIALNTWQIQKLKSRIEELEKKIEALES